MQILAIVGPTATGKSELSLEKASEIIKNHGTAEIINADAMQLYKYMDIGTAKLKLKNQKNIKHHLLSVFEPSKEISVYDFQKMARKIVDNLLKDNVTPIIVGGSGLYIKALLDDVNFPAYNKNIREKVEDLGAEKAYEKLKELAPEIAKSIDENNSKRVFRALESLSQSADYKSKMPEWKYYYKDVKQIGIKYKSLDEAKNKISIRVEKMLESGLANEVEELNNKYKLSRTAIEAIGYKQTIDYLNGRYSLDELKEVIILKTFQLYKKQLKWFKRDERIVWNEI